MPEHVNIPESGLHEPKGASSAPVDTTYIGNGAGSGVWRKVDANTMQGSISNSNPVGLAVVTDGSGGLGAVRAPGGARGAMSVTSNSTAVTVPAAVDPTLGTNTDYVVISLPFIFSELKGMNTGSNFLSPGTSGTYQVSLWANARSSVNTTTIAIKYLINGATYSSRRPKARLPNAGDIANFGATGLFSLTEGDQVQIALASTTSANITLEDLSFSLSLVEADL